MCRARHWPGEYTSAAYVQQTSSFRNTAFGQRSAPPRLLRRGLAITWGGQKGLKHQRTRRDVG